MNEKVKLKAEVRISFFCFFLDLIKFETFAFRICAGSFEL